MSDQPPAADSPADKPSLAEWLFCIDRDDSLRLVGWLATSLKQDPSATIQEELTHFREFTEKRDAEKEAARAAAEQVNDSEL